MPDSETNLLLPRHGGNLAWAMRAFPAAPRPWIDLSTGINPTPWPAPELAHLALHLPDPDDLAALESNAAAAFHANPARVVAVPGAEIGLRLLPGLLKTEDVSIVSPTYASHGEAWTASGAALSLVAHDALHSVRRQIVIVVNPNNPDGKITPRATLEEIAARREKIGGWVIVDESFVEVTPEISLASTPGDNVIVIRSFGKFYGLPGLRLGFVIAPPALAARLRALLGDWPVSSAAIEIGRRAYGDTQWQIETRRRLGIEADTLDHLLQTYGLRVIGGTALFRLVDMPDAARLYHELASRGVLVRAFADIPHWLRFGLPSPGDRARLEEALASAV